MEKTDFKLLDKKEADLLFIKQALQEQIVNIDAQLVNIRDIRNTYLNKGATKSSTADSIEPAIIVDSDKPKNKNDDILSLLRDRDDDDIIFGLYNKTEQNIIVSNPSEPTDNSEGDKTDAIDTTIPIQDEPATIEFEPITPKDNELYFIGKIYNIKSYSDVYIKVCELLISKKPYIIPTITKNEQLNNDQDINFSFKEQDIKSNSHKLSNGLWIHLKEDTDEIISICHILLEFCGYAKKDIQIGTIN